MALSVLDACHYFGLGDTGALFAAIAIIVGLGVLNWYGPKHSGGAAIFISIATVITLATIIIVSAPSAIEHAQIIPLQGSLSGNWEIFVGIILSISGIEAVSNMTGLMKDPVRDSRRAIVSVLAKVIIATVFLSLAMHAIPELSRTEHKEEMLRFLGEHYIGHWFGWIVAVTVGLLLISAGNTALNALISIQFLMAVDKELPSPLRRLNRYGVPIIPLVIATGVPVFVLMLVNDVLTLAQLYAIGVVGAILINIASTATDTSLSLKLPTRLLMTVSALVLFLVESSIAIDKPKASVFAGVVLFVGLGARYVAQRREKIIAVQPAEAIPAPIPIKKTGRKTLPSARYLLAVKGSNDRLLNFALDEAKSRNAFLFVLRVKEIAVGMLPERIELLTNGEERHIAEVCNSSGVDYQIVSIPSNEVGYTIAEQAATFGVDRVIVGAPSRSLIENVLKGSTVRSIGSLLPEEIQLIIFGG
jgi:amino acid transporter